MNRLLTIAEALRWAERYLGNRGVPSPYVDAEYILAHILGCHRKDLLIYHDRLIKDDEAAKINACLIRRGEREPLQYIIGEVEFRGFLFRVNKNVLIPRPETELLVDEAINSADKQDVTVLDLCTGSGCIAVCIANELADSRVYAVDISEAALSVARENASRNAAGGRITFLAGDLFGAIASMNLKGKIDIIVSNPPYVTEEEMQELQPEIKEFEPVSALYGGIDGLDFYRRIIHEAPSYLVTGGYIILEMGYRQAKGIKTIFNSESSFSQIETIKDIAGSDRIIKARSK